MSDVVILLKKGINLLQSNGGLFKDVILNLRTLEKFRHFHHPKISWYWAKLFIT